MGTHFEFMGAPYPPWVGFDDAGTGLRPSAICPAVQEGDELMTLVNVGRELGITTDFTVFLLLGVFLALLAIALWQGSRP